MDRIIAPYTVAAAQADAAPATGTPAYATDGNPASNIPATQWPAYQYNAIQEELMAVILGAGITADRTNNAQLLAAIKALRKSSSILADTGAANAYTAVNATPLVAGTWVDGVVQQVKIAHANTGASTYAPDGLTAIPIYGLGLQPLQGGELALNGTAVLMHATIPGVNSGNPICVLMECAGGAQQTAPATASQHAVQLGQVAGVVGSVRNFVMDVTAASSTATATADEIIVESALGGLRYCLANFNKTINLATTGAGGMDTGSPPASGFVALYAIYNPTTGASALLATNATSAAQPNVYGGANMPTGYTASGLVAVWQTTGAGQFGIAYQQDREYFFAPATILNTSVQTVSLTALTISSLVPKNAKSVRGETVVATSVACAAGVQVAGNPTGYGRQDSGITTSGAQSFNSWFADLPLREQQKLYYNFNGTSGTVTFTLQLGGYKI